MSKRLITERRDYAPLEGTPEQIIAECRRLVAEHGLDIRVVHACDWDSCETVLEWQRPETIAERAKRLTALRKQRLLKAAKKRFITDVSHINAFLLKRGPA